MVESEAVAAESQALAVDISLAALLGEGVYNFGELLLHPIVRLLQSRILGGAALRCLHFETVSL